jgi:hypothetical protein
MSKPAPVHAGSSRLSNPASALLSASRCLTASRVTLPVHGVSTTRATTPAATRTSQPPGIPIQQASTRRSADARPQGPTPGPGKPGLRSLRSRPHPRQPRRNGRQFRVPRLDEGPSPKKRRRGCVAGFSPVPLSPRPASPGVVRSPGRHGAGLRGPHATAVRCPLLSLLSWPDPRACGLGTAVSGAGPIR